MVENSNYPVSILENEQECIKILLNNSTNNYNNGYYNHNDLVDPKIWLGTFLNDNIKYFSFVSVLPVFYFKQIDGDHQYLTGTIQFASENQANNYLAEKKSKFLVIYSITKFINGRIDLRLAEVDAVAYYRDQKINKLLNNK